MFELSLAMTKNHTNFYEWLGVEPAATTAEIGKAHRELVLKLHPDIATVDEAQEKFMITNQVAFVLRSTALRPLYDYILFENKGKIPFWKGFYYAYSRYKLQCMVLFLCIAAILLEYLKAWDHYMTEKLAMDQFIQNAKLMAGRLSDKHASAKTHRSYIDLGHRTLECEITEDKEIFIIQQDKRLPLSSSQLIQKPNIFNTFLLRYPVQWIQRFLTK
ncbi:hypothetical protein CU098_002121 [Rhizopus stolonifer]|uniref:J domain-containing protein n=1 Tax=Rhizopus stolonifer TaxID=4846 RepID=A0A367KJ50_RHIST|nr:hypothetical protein CU098_002121 [Rhizopus stolonifer]